MSKKLKIRSIGNTYILDENLILAGHSSYNEKTKIYSVRIILDKNSSEEIHQDLYIPVSKNLDDSNKLCKKIHNQINAELINDDVCYAFARKENVILLTLNGEKVSYGISNRFGYDQEIIFNYDTELLAEAYFNKNISNLKLNATEISLDIDDSTVSIQQIEIKRDMNLAE